MSASPKTFSLETTRRIVRIQALTLVWMSVEAVVSLGAAWFARSPALLGFGGDSAVELLSAAVVLWRFYSPSRGDRAERQAARTAGGLLFVLAAFVAITSVLALLGHVEARSSPIGIVVLILATVVMPWLAKQKRQLSAATASAALRADAAESTVCGYLALIALVGLAVNAIWAVRWADPVAALALLPLILREGWEATKGKPCCDMGWTDGSRMKNEQSQDEDVRDDISMVRLFLSRYQDPAGNSYRLAERPDVVERNAPAIEAVAHDAHGHRLAVEHTLIQPFEGQKSDDLPFLKGFERLRLDDSLRVPDRLIEVIPPAFAIPRGFDWDAVGQTVHDWFKGARLTFGDGDSWHTIPNLPFKLEVLVQTMDIAGTEGVVSVSRLLPKDRPFREVLRIALARKIPKLVATPAETRILLLEDASSAIGFRQVIEGIDVCREEFPQLSDVTAIWVVKTIAWKTAGDVWFCHVWPGGVMERFRIQS